MESSILKLIESEHFHFDFRRAIFWQERRILIASDLHWGKTQFLRHHGIAVSDNVFEADLSRLSHLIEDYRPSVVLVLGDLVHHEKSLSSDIVEKVAWFRHRFPCEFVLVKGNHDRFTHFPDAWAIVEESDFYIQQFYFSHDYNKQVRAFQFAGHVHPTLRLRSGFDSLRFPAFVLSESFCLLPAFSALTGGQDVKLERGAEALVVLPEGMEIFRK